MADDWFEEDEPERWTPRLAPAEVFHEALEHRWFLSEAEGRDVGVRRAGGPSSRRMPWA